MKSKTFPATTLARAVGKAEFGECHGGVIDAGLDATWRAVHAVAWSDLRLARPLLLIRGLTAGGGELERRSCLTSLSSHAVVYEDAPTETMFVQVGKPWCPRPQFIELSGLEQVRGFDQPGWLKYGMEWHLTPLPGDRTFVETRTLCTPTDAAARRMFSAYWLLIRAGSGLIRHEMIAAIRRIAATTPHARARPGSSDPAPGRIGVRVS